RKLPTLIVTDSKFFQTSPGERHVDHPYVSCSTLQLLFHRIEIRRAQRVSRCAVLLAVAACFNSHQPTAEIPQPRFRMISSAEAAWNVSCKWQIRIAAQDKSLDVMPMNIFGFFHFHSPARRNTESSSHAGNDLNRACRSSVFALMFLMPSVG